MEHISNEQKANEIANAFFIENVSAENEQVIREMLNKASFEAMRWKDEQFEELLNSLPQGVKDLIKTLAI